MQASEKGLCHLLKKFRNSEFGFDLRNPEFWIRLQEFGILDPTSGIRGSVWLCKDNLPDPELQDLRNPIVDAETSQEFRVDEELTMAYFQAKWDWYVDKKMS